MATKFNGFARDWFLWRRPSVLFFFLSRRPSVLFFLYLFVANISFVFRTWGMESDLISAKPWNLTEQEMSSVAQGKQNFVLSRREIYNGGKTSINTQVQALKSFQLKTFPVNMQQFAFQQKLFQSVTSPESSLWKPPPPPVLKPQQAWRFETWVYLSLHLVSFCLSFVLRLASFCLLRRACGRHRRCLQCKYICGGPLHLSSPVLHVPVISRQLSDFFTPPPIFLTFGQKDFILNSARCWPLETQCFPGILSLASNVCEFRWHIRAFSRCCGTSIYREVIWRLLSFWFPCIDHEMSSPSFVPPRSLTHEGSLSKTDLFLSRPYSPNPPVLCTVCTEGACTSSRLAAQSPGWQANLRTAVEDKVALVGDWQICQERYMYITDLNGTHFNQMANCGCCSTYTVCLYAYCCWTAKPQCCPCFTCSFLLFLRDSEIRAWKKNSKNWLKAFFYLWDAEQTLFNIK